VSRGRDELGPSRPRPALICVYCVVDHGSQCSLVELAIRAVADSDRRKTDSLPELAHWAGIEL
jgi:hypothetical protein